MISWPSYENKQTRIDGTSKAQKLLDSYKVTTVTWLDIVYNSVEDNDLFLQYIIAVIAVESHFRPDVVSSAGAIGLMQVTKIAEKEARQYCQIKNLDSLTDVAYNILIGSCYFKWAREQTGSYIGALMVYNGGMRQYNRWVAGKNLPTETAQYVLKVLAIIKERQ